MDGEWKNQIYSTAYPFTGDNTNAIEVTVSFWAKTTDTDPDSENASGDLKVIVRDTGSGSNVDRTERVILTTDSWTFIEKTFNTFPAATNYSLQLRIQLGKLNGVTQIDGITTSVTGGATLDASPEPAEETLNGFVTNPSFDDSSGGTIPQWQTLDNWKLEGNLATGNNYGIIQTNDVYDGSNIEVANEVAANEWQNKVTSADYAFDGNNTDPIEVTVSFWAKTTDTDPASGNTNGDLKLIVRDTGSGSNVDRTARVILTTDSWTNHTLTFTTFPAAASYTLALSFQFGKLEGVTQIDGITSSVTGGASLGLNEVAPLIPDPPVPDSASLAQLTAQCEYTTPLDAPIATDNCDGIVPGQTTTTLPITASTTITWTFTDSAGNSSTQTQDVIIQDTDPPTGDAQQSFDTAATIADLVATGDNLQWYDAATDGNLLDSSAALTNGQVVYASQTVNGCESTDRLEVTVTISVGYCESVPSSNDGQGITQIVLAASTFTSGGDITYEDFTSPTVDVSQAVETNLQITFATPGYTYDTNVWIDLNNDLVYDSATELVFDGVSTSANPTTLNASFTVPNGTANGVYNMRIGTADSGQTTPNPCYNGSWGVTIDMTINVTAPPILCTTQI